MSVFLDVWPCWHAQGWESASEFSVQDATKVSRGQARMRYVAEGYDDWRHVGVWKRYIRALDRQERYEWWVEDQEDGWDGHPDVAPDGWQEPCDEDAPAWEFCRPDHPEAEPAWICGLRSDGAPPKPRRAERTAA